MRQRPSLAVTHDCSRMAALMLPAEILAATRDRAPEAERLLEALVNESSGSRHLEGVARAVERVAGELDRLGFATELVREGGRTRHVRARLRGSKAAADARRVVLIGHADTVFPPSDDRRFAIE